MVTLAYHFILFNDWLKQSHFFGILRFCMIHEKSKTRYIFVETQQSKNWKLKKQNQTKKTHNQSHMWYGMALL